MARQIRAGGSALLCAAALYAAAPLNFCAADAPRRIVSINLCADQYLLALAAPEQILALSPYARDEGISFHAAKARPYQRVRDDVESVLALRPDLVLASVYNHRSALDRIEKAGIAVRLIEDAAALSAIRAQIIEIGAWLGRGEAAAALAASFDDAAAKARGRWLGSGVAALYYERGGYAPGASGLVHELMAHAGLENAAARLPGKGASFVPLEAVLAAAPDIIISGGREMTGDQGAAMLDHPALYRAYPPHRRMTLPARETVCPGPSTIAALRTLTGGAR